MLLAGTEVAQSGRRWWGQGCLNYLSMAYAWHATPKVMESTIILYQLRLGDVKQGHRNISHGQWPGKSMRFASTFFSVYFPTSFLIDG